MPSILITGANRGLGLEFVRQYCAVGWTVTATCRDPAKADVLNALNAEVFALDLTDAAQISALATGPLARRTFDVLLNNAGLYGETQSLGKLNAADWDCVLRTNTIAPLMMAQAFLPHVERSEKRIMAFVSSVMGSLAANDSGGAYVYRSSKAALNAAVRGLTCDLTGRVITVLLHPGWVRTDMGGTDASIEPETSVTGLRQVIDGMTPETSGAFLNYKGVSLPW